MTDRELLELAAKAAGIEIHHWSDGRLPHECPVLNDGITDQIKTFDPLTDDGDALRLAVKLQIGIDTEGERCSAYSDYETVTVAKKKDPYAAARRAIARAAAEIGRSLSADRDAVA